MHEKKIITAIICFLLTGAFLINITGCGMEVKAADLMEGIQAAKVSGKAADDTWIGSSADFALELFKQSVAQDKNALISPLSVMLALAMTANGADSQTKAEMEALLGGTISLDDLNKYLYSYVNNLPSDKDYKVEIANSIWFRDDENRLKVEKAFLQTNADYYGASAYKSPFDEQTVKDINNWVKKHTDGMIDEIVDQIDADTILYLINALVFDAKWQVAYEKGNVYEDSFTAYNKDVRTVDMMFSEESRYLDDGNAVGFIKPYKDNKYSFVALLPNEDISIGDYVASLTGDNFLATMQNAKNAFVEVRMPKFSYDYTIEMNKALKGMGMPTAFDSGAADFSKMGQSSYGNIYIGEVLHKTFISVDELGTKAGAVTKVEMKDECAAIYDYFVKLNRPFVYAIVDNATNLPLFIGTVMDII